MNRRAVLLSPYRMPTYHPVSLADGELRAWLNGLAALWHPALVLSLAGPPRVDSPYDHDSPQAGDVFAQPEQPHLYQADDWRDRVARAGAGRFEATADRAQTLANLVAALAPLLGEGEADARSLLALPPERVAPFLAVGYGYHIVDTLFEAMDHEKLLPEAEFWDDVRQAARVAQSDEATEHLKRAAERLSGARDVLSPSMLHVLDIARVDPKRPDAPWPAALAAGVPLNVLLSGESAVLLERDAPARLAELHDAPNTLEIVGGVAAERADSLLPTESQLWNLAAGRAAVESAGRRPVSVWGRATADEHPQLPQLLAASGFRHALLPPASGTVRPPWRAAVVNWSSPDGKSVDALAREPLPAHEATTYFNLVYTIKQAISDDSSPTLALMHSGEQAFDSYADWLALSRLAPALGQWATLSRYFAEAYAGEYAGTASADEFFADELDRRCQAHLPDPVSDFARHARTRRALDSALTLAAATRALTGGPLADDEAQLLADLDDAEEALERPAPAAPAGVADTVAALLDRSAARLAARLQARAAPNRPGLMLLNPCPYARRVVLERSDIRGPLPIDGPVKAGEFADGLARLVVEVPPLGYAWLPREGPPGCPPPKPRLVTADGTSVRNEFFEAELDPKTGGLRAFRDLRTRVNRLGQILAWQPGGKMVARSVRVTSVGAALGEVTSEGDIVDDAGEPVARFAQRLRAWVGRPLLELRIDLEPLRLIAGYPWHAYLGSRWVWREERAALFRLTGGVSAVTGATRPVTPDALDVRQGKSSTAILPGGLPFHQKQGGRMLDTVLLCEGETATRFEFGLLLDRDLLAPAAQGWLTPTIAVPTESGPPAPGPTGWLFHLDAPNLLLSSLRPERRDGRVLTARLLETSGFAGTAELSCFRGPASAAKLDADGAPLTDWPAEDGRATLEFSANELFAVRVDLG